MCCTSLVQAEASSLSAAGASDSQEEEGETVEVQEVARMVLGVPPHRCVTLPRNKKKRL